MDQAHFLMIVRRGQIERYEFLEKAFTDEPIQVIWDRRIGERRGQTQPTSMDRRQGERRRQLPTSWDVLDFVVAKEQSALAAK